MIHGIISVGGLYVLLGAQAIITIAGQIINLFH